MRIDISDIYLKENERVDDLQRCGYRIIQNPNGFCFGMDGVLLSGFARAQAGDKILDMGTGTGIIPILMAAKTKADYLIGLEIQSDCADMARRSVRLNNLERKIEIMEGDIREAGKLFAAASFDVITSNPPYMTRHHGLINPADPKAIARHELFCTLEDIIRAASHGLRPGGHFYMVHRPFRLPEIMTVMRQYGLEPKRMRLVYPYVEKEPSMVLLEGRRGGKPQLTVEKPLIIYKEKGVYTEEIYDIYGY